MPDMDIENAKKSWHNAPDSHVFEAVNNIENYDDSIRDIILQEAVKRRKNNEEYDCEQKENEKQNAKFQKFKRHANIYIFLIFILSISLLIYACSKYYVNPAEGFVDHLADLTVKAFWLGIIIFFIYIREKKIKATLKGKKKTLLVYFTILCVIANYKSINMLIEASKYPNSEKITEDFSSVVEDIYSGKPVTQEFKEDEYGELAPLLQTAIEWGNEIQQEYEEMFIELSKCDLTSIGQLESFANPKRLAELKENTFKAEQILQRYEESSKLLFEDIEQRVLLISNVSEKTKKQFLSGLAESEDDSLESIDALVEIHKEYIKTYKELISFIELQKFKVEDGKLYFFSQDDGNLYNSYMLGLQNISQKESALVDKLRQEAYSDINEKIKKLE